MGGFFMPSAPPPPPPPPAPAQVAKVAPKVTKIEDQGSSNVEAKANVDTTRRKPRGRANSLISLDSTNSSTNTILGG